MTAAQVRHFAESQAAEQHANRLGLAGWAWAAYFASAPVVWLPGLSTSIVAALKALLFGVAVWSTWTSADRPRFPPGILGPLGAAALLLSASFGLFQAASRGAMAIAIYSLVLPFVVLWSFWNLRAPVRRLARAALVSATALAALSSVVVYAGLARPEFLSGPSPLGNTAAWISGFGTKSTGWSHGVALFVPFLAVSAFAGTARRALLALAGMFLIIWGQFIVYGRGGLAISVLIVLAVVAVQFRRMLIWVIATMLLLAIPVTMLATDPTQPARSSVVEAGAFETLDDFSTQRLYLTQQGLALISKRPLSGYGFENDYILSADFRAYYQVHVTWLRLAVQGGLLFALVFLAIVLTIATRAIGVLWNARRSDLYRPLLACVLVICGGLMSTLVEPSGLIGAFHTSAIWWAAAGATTRFAFDSASQSSRNTRHWRPTTDTFPA